MRTNFWSGLVAFAVAAVLMAWIIPQYGGRGFGGSISPKLMPYVGSSIMLAASAAVWIRAAVEMARAGQPLAVPVAWRGVVRQLWPFAFVALAVVVIGAGGLIYSGPFLIAALLLILGERRPAVILPAALVPPALIAWNRRWSS